MDVALSAMFGAILSRFVDIVSVESAAKIFYEAFEIYYIEYRLHFFISYMLCL